MFEKSLEKNEVLLILALQNQGTFLYKKLNWKNFQNNLHNLEISTYTRNNDKKWLILINICII